MCRFALFLALGWLLPLLGPAAESSRFLNGVDANYVAELEQAGGRWRGADGVAEDPYRLLARAGANAARIRLWTRDDGPSGLRAATELARRAQAAGLAPYLVLFLSEEWSDMVKQPAPAAWRALPEEQRLRAIEEYAERVTRHFQQAGLRVELFEIGNEIDFGICGVFEPDWAKRVSLDYMRTMVWPRMAKIIAAAQRGVRKAEPKARFILHLAQWTNAPYCLAFWQEMGRHGVAVDLPGLSYFPTSAKPEERSLDFLRRQLQTLHAALGRPLVICEYGYPSQPKFPGQFAEWNQPVPGFELSPAGQRAWLAAFQAFARSAESRLAGTFYWSPEWIRSNMWEAFALFDDDGVAKPALAALGGGGSAEAPATQPTPTPLPASPLREIAASPAPRIFFGNLHAHTAYSDGKGTPEDAYLHARDVAKLDFLALTEHNHLLGGDKATAAQRTRLYTGPEAWALVPTARRFNQPGRFVALHGQEFSSMSKGNHVNVFDVDDVIDVPNGAFDQLLRWLDQRRDAKGRRAVVMLNHPGLGRPGKTIEANEFGRDDFGDDTGWVREMGATTQLIELVNGAPKTPLMRRWASQIMEEHYKMYLRLGFRLAPTADQDNHEWDWGNATDARTGILAPELTKEALLEAMRARHVYASEDANLRLAVRVNGRLCGDVIPTAPPAEDLQIELQIRDDDEPDAAYTIDVFTGTVGGELATVAKTVQTRGNTPPGKARAIDGVRLSRPGEFVFFRFTQQNAAPAPDGTLRPDRVWTAPVWFDASAR
ncbi:MAG: glycosyl hydrolase 53 family protein [Verrucomicrobia bacterium]|nr:glycosyl hydrolase 53 family protein [Verrucomicrobiota bacterium]